MLEKLVLTTTSLHNVVIANTSDTIFYEVVTPKWQPHLTRVSRLNLATRAFDVVGELQNDGARPVAVRVRGGEMEPAREFLRVVDVAGKGTRCSRFTGADGSMYLWKIRDRHLELFKEGASDSQPVAVYYRPKRYLFLLRMTRLPYLEIDTSVLDTLDTLILSFLLVERRRRHGVE